MHSDCTLRFKFIFFSINTEVVYVFPSRFNGHFSSLPGENLTPRGGGFSGCRKRGPCGLSEEKEPGCCWEVVDAKEIFHGNLKGAP